MTEFLFTGKIDNVAMERESGYAFYSLPKAGGEPERIPLPVEENFLNLICSYRGKIYFRSDYSNHIYRYDLLKQFTELVCGFESKNEPLFYFDGYVYYKENQRDVPKEGYSDQLVMDLYRQPLDSLRDLT